MYDNLRNIKTAILNCDMEGHKWFLQEKGLNYDSNKTMGFCLH